MSNIYKYSKYSNIYKHSKYSKYSKMDKRAKDKMVRSPGENGGG